MAVAPSTGPVDLTERYTLIGGVPVIARSADVVQIGSEAPLSLLLHQAPPDAVLILKRLNGSRPLGAVLEQFAADPRPWSRVLTRLRDARLLVPVDDWSFPGAPPGPFLDAERDSLVHRHGVSTARRVLQARRDAVVVVRGAGRLATAIATSLALSGLGHVHQQPDRALRISDLPDVAPPRRVAATSDGRHRPDRGGSATAASPRRPTSADPAGTPTRLDASLLAANLHRSAPDIRVHPPVSDHDVALVILAGDGPPAPSLAAELTGGHVAHLAVRAGLTSAVVGPFVLPGRSSCLGCALRQRTATDPGRPAVEAALRREVVVPPAQLVCAAAALAVADALDHLDGITVPSTVDGTVEWRLGELSPRRRSWAAHPDCGCCGGPITPSAEKDPPLTGPSS